MEIVIAPNPILREKAEAYEKVDASLRRLAHKMARTMYDNRGCGLAAPQVGVSKRLVVIDCSEGEEENPIYLVNPVVVETKGDPVTEGEGCLSFPGITVPITRKPFAKVTYTDLGGVERTIEGDGLLGRCLQHEIDHLNGRTLFEACAPMDRIKAMNAYQQALAAGAKPGDTEISEDA